MKTKTTASSKGAEWKRRFEEWRASGLSQREFCRQAGVSFSGFHYWRHRLFGKGGDRSEKLVRVGSIAASKVSTVRIHLGGHVVEVDAAVEAEHLKTILAVVRDVT